MVDDFLVKGVPSCCSSEEISTDDAKDSGEDCAKEQLGDGCGDGWEGPGGELGAEPGRELEGERVVALMAGNM
jgi:hypothetical protein